MPYVLVMTRELMTNRVVLMMSDSDLEMVARFKSTQDDNPSQAEAIRRLLYRGAEAQSDHAAELKGRLDGLEADVNALRRVLGV